MRGVAPAVVVLLLALALAAPAAARSADVAALQVALRAEGLYRGDVDGLGGLRTASAIRALQRREGLAADGVAGRRTRRALGRRGRPAWGSRTLRTGRSGWDVAALQFKLARHGFPSGRIDGGMGGRTAAALRRFQARAGLAPDGIAGLAVRRALRAPPQRSPIALRRPVDAPLGDRYGPRGDRWHAGLDFPAPAGTAVRAPAPGTVAGVGEQAGGWGRHVVVDHGAGVRSLHAHLSRATVVPGEVVAGGERIGLVGSSGASSGPHLHLELLVGGANVDPVAALGL